MIDRIPRPKIVLPLLALALGVVGLLGLGRAKRTPERRPPEIPPPLVRVLEVSAQTIRLDVKSQGQVAPVTASDLVAEVPGRVVEVSPKLAAGAFFEAGEILAVIDRRDHEIAVTRAEAAVARAEVRLAREEGEARIARRDWETLGEGDPDPLVLREPQLAEARADLAAARADLAKAGLDLERTRIRAPYDGRVRAKTVDLGQYVLPGTPIARVYGIEGAEIRLLITTEELAFLDLPLDPAGQPAGPPGGRGPEVTLEAQLGGERARWVGRIVRTEGEIDPVTRMLPLVARVDDPYGRDSDRDGPPLTVGLFVEARIAGRVVEDVFRVPRSALRGPRRLLVLDDGDRLRFRHVEVLRLDGETAILEAGLEEGERICLSPIEVPVDGMSVRVERPDPESTDRRLDAAEEDAS
jgi:RND family efflux transporter MFP subunit